MQQPSATPSLPAGKSLSVRLRDTMFLILLAGGYATGLGYAYLNYGNYDGKAGLSIRDIQYRFGGNPTQSSLLSQMKGPMRPYLPQGQQGERMIQQTLRLITAGTTEQQYRLTIKPILLENCTMCHSVGRVAGHAPLTTYQQVLRYTAAGRPPPVMELLRNSHAHLIALALAAFVVAVIYLSHVRAGRWISTSLVASPFVGIAADVGGWWLIRVHAGFAYLTVVGAALALASLTIMGAWSLLRIWRPK